MSTLTDYKFGDSESVAPMDEAEIDRKHKELRDVTDTRIRSLEGLLKQRDADLQAKEETLALVTQDFHYNVNLIKERDEELQSFEDATDNMRQAIHERDEEAASLRAQLETAQEDAKTQRAHAAELQEHYQGQMLEIKTEREALKRQHETELHTRDDEIRTLTNQLQQQRTDLFKEAETKIDKHITGFSAQISEKETVYRNREGDLQEQLQQKLERINALSLEVQHGANAAEKLRSELLEKNQEIADMDSKLTALGELHAQQISEIHAGLDSEVTERCRSLQKEVNNAEQLLQQETQRSNALETSLEQTKQNVITNEDRLVAKDAEIRDLQNALTEQKLRAENDRTESLKDHDTHRQEVVTLQLATQKLELKNESLSENLQSRNTEVGELKIEVERLKSEVLLVTKDQSHSQAMLESCRERLKSGEQDSSDLLGAKLQLRESEANRRREEEKVEEMALRLQDAARQISSLQTAVETTSELHTLRAQQPHNAPRPRQNDSLHAPHLHDVSSINAWPTSTVSPFPAPLDSSGSEYGPIAASPFAEPKGTPPLPNQNVAHLVNAVAEQRTLVDELKKKNRVLAEQNARIRDQVKQFTSDMAAEPIVKNATRLQAENEDLKRELKQLKAEIESLSADVATSRIAARSSNSGQHGDIIPKLTSELLSLREDLDAERKRCKLYEALASGRRGDREDRRGDSGEDDGRYRRKYEKVKIAHHAVVKENRELKAKIGQAKQDIQRVVGEKEALLEINNRMRADINKFSLREAVRDTSRPSRHVK